MSLTNQSSDIYTVGSHNPKYVCILFENESEMAQQWNATSYYY